MKYVGKEPHAVGKKISTKAVGSNRRNDITDEYKYPEGESVKQLYRDLVSK